MLSTSISSTVYFWYGEANPAGFPCVRSQARWDLCSLCSLTQPHTGYRQYYFLRITKNKSITLLFSHEPCHRQSKGILFISRLHLCCVVFILAPAESRGLISSPPVRSTVLLRSCSRCPGLTCLHHLAWLCCWVYFGQMSCWGSMVWCLCPLVPLVWTLM